MTDEKTLLAQAKAYDLDALSELYTRYAPTIYAYIYRRVGNAAVAEDLTGELFVRMLRAIHNERAWRDSFRAWLYRIAHNLVVDHYRGRGAVTVVYPWTSQRSRQAKTIPLMTSQSLWWPVMTRISPVVPVATPIN